MNPLPPFQLWRATTTSEAVDALADGWTPYRGGTELLVAMRTGLFKPDKLVDLKRIDELSRVSLDDGSLRVGATVSHAHAARHPAVVEYCEALAGVFERVGNVRVRSQGSVGGNVCFAEPRSDLVTALAALRAQIVLESVRGRREVPAQVFTLGPYWTERAEDELLVRVDVPVATGGVMVYQKYQVIERPTAGIAVAAASDGTDCRVVVGAVGVVPALFQFDHVQEVDAGMVADGVDPVADLAGGEEYKRHIVDEYVRRAKNRVIAILEERE